MSLSALFALICLSGSILLAAMGVITQNEFAFEAVGLFLVISIVAAVITSD